MAEDNKSALLALRGNYESILNNIEWNLAGFVSAAFIIINPKLLDLQAVPMRISVDGLDIDGFQCLGLALIEKDRQPRANELLAAAKRSLICESLEVSADFLARAARIASCERDPYARDDYFSVDMRELWNTKRGRAGSLLEEGDREFIEKCVAPLRNFIRHNNGKLPPRRSILYAGKPKSKEFNFSMVWSSDGTNDISATLHIAHDVFVTLRDIGLAGFGRALASSA